MGIKTATDVTGFGLLGHLSEIVLQSGVTAELYADRVPVFEEVLEYLRQGMISGAIERNREYASRLVRVEKDVEEGLEAAFYDPQTSGGLLIAVEEEKADSLISRLKKKGVRQAAAIGKIVGKSDGKILLKKDVLSIVSQ
jgi:selenide,water dikinase